MLFMSRSIHNNQHIFFYFTSRIKGYLCSKIFLGSSIWKENTIETSSEHFDNVVHFVFHSLNKLSLTMLVSVKVSLWPLSFIASKYCLFVLVSIKSVGIKLLKTWPTSLSHSSSMVGSDKGEFVFYNSREFIWSIFHSSWFQSSITFKIIKANFFSRMLYTTNFSSSFKRLVVYDVLVTYFEF